MLIRDAEKPDLADITKIHSEASCNWTIEGFTTTVVQRRHRNTDKECNDKYLPTAKDEWKGRQLAWLMMELRRAEMYVEVAGSDWSHTEPIQHLGNVLSGTVDM